MDTMLFIILGFILSWFALVIAICLTLGVLYGMYLVTEWATRMDALKRRIERL